MTSPDTDVDLLMIGAGPVGRYAPVTALHGASWLERVTVRIDGPGRAAPVMDRSCIDCGACEVGSHSTGVTSVDTPFVAEQ